MRLREGGLLWQAPVCSSFVFANSSNCKRTIDNPYGDEGYEAVVQGNHMAMCAAFLMALACARNIEVAIGNPVLSQIFRFPPLAKVLEGLKVSYHITDACAFSSKPFGKRFLKTFKIAATGQWAERMVKRCRCEGGVHLALMTTGENGSVSGTKALKESQAYPPRLGKAVVKAWLTSAKLEGPSTCESEPAAASAANWLRPAAQKPTPKANSTPKAKSMPTARTAAVQKSWLKPKAG